MRLDECYRLLEIDSSASDDDVRRAHRELTKVWHPDRFGQDVSLRERAGEKLKTINEAYETILEARRSGWTPPRRERPPAESASPAELRRFRIVRARNWAIGLALAATLILLRRPTTSGLITAGVLFLFAYGFLLQMRRS